MMLVRNLVLRFLCFSCYSVIIYGKIYKDGFPGLSVTAPCLAKHFGGSSIVCVCNATYCDALTPTLEVASGHYEVYQTTQKGDRFKKMVGVFENSGTFSASVDITMTIDPNVTYQSLMGFGGAITDSAGINILKLSAKTQQNLLASYYSPSGIEYTMGRIPMAACDFSTHEYSYDDNDGDFELKKFSLTVEDYKYKIPIFQKAQAMSRRKINLFGSPWSAPAWLKTNDKMHGKGSLKGQAGDKYHKTWANYFIRFLQEYKKENITFWGMTAQNEPTDGEIVFFRFTCMGFTAVQQRDFIVSDLGPALEKNGFADVKLMILDDNRFLLPDWANVILRNKTASKYVSGIGVHWYLDGIGPPDATLDPVHKEFPDKFILATEACEGSSPFIRNSERVKLGDWERAENYAKSILQDLNHWVVGWMDWNIALDETGGPNWDKNFVDSPIIVNATNDEFYKQPMFYALGHFSKFLPKDSVRIDLKSSSNDLDAVAFDTPEHTRVIIVNNRSDKDITFAAKDPVYGILQGSSPAKSLQTYVWTTK